MGRYVASLRMARLGRWWNGHRAAFWRRNGVEMYAVGFGGKGGRAGLAVIAVHEQMRPRQTTMRRARQEEGRMLDTGEK